MKIAYVLTQDRGGLPHYTAELANAVAQNHEVYVLKPSVTSADDMFAERVQVVNCFKPMGVSNADLENGTINPITALRGFLSYRNMGVLNSIDPEIVHITTYLLPQVRWSLFLNRLDTKYDIFVTYHNTDFYLLGGGEGKHRVTQVKNILNVFSPNPQISGAIVHREENKTDLIERGYDSQSVHVIPHGTYKTFSKYGNQAKTEENTVLAFGNIVPGKAIDTLAKAIDIAREDIPDLKLIIAGDGEIPDNVNGLVNNSQAFEVHNEYIPNEEVGKYFERASLFAIPNRRQEGQSGSMTIAYDFGLPVVATDIGPFPRWVEQEGCGYTVEPDQPEEMADAIVEILRNEELRDSMSSNARRVADKLSWENISDRHIEAYQSSNEEQRDV